MSKSYSKNNEHRFNSRPCPSAALKRHLARLAPAFSHSFISKLFYFECQTSISLEELDVSVSAHLAVKSIDSLVQDVEFRKSETLPSERAISLQNTNLNSSSNSMKHLAAYLLLGLGGNTSPSAKDVKSVLDSVGIEADDERLDKLISELEGKDLQEV